MSSDTNPTEGNETPTPDPWNDAPTTDPWAAELDAGSDDPDALPFEGLILEDKDTDGTVNPDSTGYSSDDDEDSESKTLTSFPKFTELPLELQGEVLLEASKMLASDSLPPERFWTGKFDSAADVVQRPSTGDYKGLLTTSKKVTDAVLKRVFGGNRILFDQEKDNGDPTVLFRQHTPANIARIVDAAITFTVNPHDLINDAEDRGTELDPADFVKLDTFVAGLDYADYIRRRLPGLVRLAVTVMSTGMLRAGFDVEPMRTAVRRKLTRDHAEINRGMRGPVDIRIPVAPNVDEAQQRVSSDLYDNGLMSLDDFIGANNDLDDFVDADDDL